MEKELLVTLDEGRQAFVKQMSHRRLDRQKGDEKLSKADYSRALAECLTFRVWLYIPSLTKKAEGKKVMAKAGSRGYVPRLRGLWLLSDAQLLRSICWDNIGACVFTPEERIIFEYCEEEIRELGEDNFVFHHPLQRAAYEQLAGEVHARERVPRLADVAKFRKVFERTPNQTLSGLLIPVQHRVRKPKSQLLVTGQLELFKSNLAPPPENFVWGQQELFERHQPSLFDLEAPWYF